ncbi:MAG TPA: PQQ-binding-like beta-propeller repeat protein [Gemmataceae bacterium]|nr:PQQ-binding-like beta-propeller repeat protein [Gemmataceae bacterium]
MPRLTPLAALFSLSLLVNAAAADWPGFRGLNGDGVSVDKDIPVKWAKDNFLWKTKLPGPGSASPIVWGDKVFVVCYGGYGLTLTKGNPLDKGKDPPGKGFPPKAKDASGDQKKLKRYVLCLDAAKGNVLWEQEVAPKLPEQAFVQMIREHGYASNTPVTDGERLYVFFGKTGVLAFDFTGKKLWTADVGTGLYVYGSASSPVLYKDLVIVNASAESKALVAVDKTNGKVVWRNKSITTTWSSPVMVKTKDGQDELVLSQPNKVAGYDPLTGKELWKCDGLPVPTGGSSYCTPVSKEGVLYLAGGAGPGSTATAFAVKSGGRGDVSKSHVLWRVKAGSTINSPVISGDFLHIVESTATCLRLDTGKQVYKQRFFDSGMEYASPVLCGDKIYQVTRFDGIYIMSAGGKFQSLGHNAFQGDYSSFNASPAVSDGRMFVRSDTHLYCIGKKAGP